MPPEKYGDDLITLVGALVPLVASPKRSLDRAPALPYGALALKFAREGGRMADKGRTRGLAGLAVVTVLGTLLSLSQSADSSIIHCIANTDCGCTDHTNCTAPDQGGICVNGTCECNPGHVQPYCDPVGACCGVSICDNQPNTGCAQAIECSELTAAQCAQLNGTYAGDLTSCSTEDICSSPTPTATATATSTATSTSAATSTPTNTPVPQGGDCMDASQCAAGLFCSDMVCCDSPCTDPLESCNQSGMEGICSPAVAPAPAASQTTLLLMLGVLLTVGGAAMALRRRNGS